MQKVWSVKKYDKEKINELVMKYNISEMLAKLILAREIEDVDIEQFPFCSSQTRDKQFEGTVIVALL